jgi:hypothetical protein
MPTQELNRLDREHAVGAAAVGNDRLVSRNL